MRSRKRSAILDCARYLLFGCACGWLGGTACDFAPIPLASALTPCATQGGDLVLERVAIERLTGSAPEASELMRWERIADLHRPGFCGPGEEVVVYRGALEMRDASGSTSTTTTITIELIED